MELVSAEMYDVLTHLQYPAIAQIHFKDFTTSILTGQNRIAMLAWLLSRASPTLSSHLEKFQGNSLKDEIVKCYSQMGISIDENTLLGNCSMKQQISTLKALLLFAQSLNSTETVPIDDSVIYEVLDKHINETINIIPPTCHVSMKLTGSEADKHIKEVKSKMIDVIRILPNCELPRTVPLTVEDKTDVGGKTESEDEEIMTLDCVAEEFNTAFESAEFLSHSKSLDPRTNQAFNIDETIQILCKDLSSVAQVFESKKAILAAKAPRCLDKCETPLSLLIENNVIISEGLMSLYDRGPVEN